MAIPRRQVNVMDEQAINHALEYLKLARSSARDAGADRAAASIGRAIKSVEGAAAHIRRLLAAHGNRGHK